MQLLKNIQVGCVEETLVNSLVGAVVYSLSYKLGTLSDLKEATKPTSLTSSWIHLFFYKSL